MRSIFIIICMNNNRRRKLFGILSNLILDKSFFCVKICEFGNCEFVLDWN